MPDTSNKLAPLSPTASYFDLLGVPVGVDEPTLTRRFRELSRTYHPDRWANADSETQTVALDGAALINDAYRVLRDPLSRAEYLLRRERGVRPDDNRQVTPPGNLFARVLELQEALMEYQEARLDDDEATMNRLRPDLEQAQADFQTDYAQLSAQAHALFARYDAGEDREKVLDGIAEVVGTRGYLRRVLTNLSGTLK
jgi:Fe-S protein assembly co-chaperone HscB